MATQDYDNAIRNSPCTLGTGQPVRLLMSFFCDYGPAVTSADISLPIHSVRSECLDPYFVGDGLVLGRGLKSDGIWLLIPNCRSVVRMPRSEQPRPVVWGRVRT